MLGKDLCLLALGVRGLSALIILEQLMETIKLRAKQDDGLRAQQDT